LPFSPLSAQEDKERGELFTRVLAVRPDFLSLGGSGNDDAIDDPFAEGGPSERPNATEILKAAGVTFPKGASAFFNPVTCQLIVRNTKENLNLAITFIEDVSREFQGKVDENAELPKQVGILVEYIQLDHGEANRLVTEHMETGNSNATALHEGLAKLITDEKAQRIATAYLVTRSGQRATIKSVVEHIYPTEYDPPEVPQKIHGPLDGIPDLKTNVTPYRVLDERYRP